MKTRLSDLENDRYGLKTIFHALMGIVVLFVGNILASLPVDLFYAVTKYDASVFTMLIRYALQLVTIPLLVCLYISKILKLPLQDFRICKQKNIGIWILCAIALPLAISCFYIFFIPGSFSASGFGIAKNVRYIVRAVFSTCLIAGITEELIFRGLIMRLLEKRWNKVIAVVIPSVLFGLLHISNMEAPNVIDIAILVIAGTAVGVMFSLIAIQSGSILASATVHGIWNLVIIGRILEISAEPFPAIFTYKLRSTSTLLTGGAFGIEASLPAIVGYCIIILVSILLLRNKPTKI